MSKKLKRYSCGNAEGMFEDKKGLWIEYSKHKSIVKELKRQLGNQIRKL